MKIRPFLSASALAIATLTSAGAFAQATAASEKPITPKIDYRDSKQQSRIHGGRESGELTKRERVRLHTEQRVIDRKQKKMEADGKVTKQERRRMDRMQDAASKDIERQKNDKQSNAN